MYGEYLTLFCEFYCKLFEQRKKKSRSFSSQIWGILLLIFETQGFLSNRGRLGKTNTSWACPKSLGIDPLLGRFKALLGKEGENNRFSLAFKNRDTIDPMLGGV